MSKQLYFNPLLSGSLRNCVCPCGSGKKVKKCCGKERSVDVLELNRINRLIKQANEEYEKAIKAAK